MWDPIVCSLVSAGASFSYLYYRFPYTDEMTRVSGLAPLVAPMGFFLSLYSILVVGVRSMSNQRIKDNALSGSSGPVNSPEFVNYSVKSIKPLKLHLIVSTPSPPSPPALLNRRCLPHHFHHPDHWHRHSHRNPPDRPPWVNVIHQTPKLIVFGK